MSSQAYELREQIKARLVDQVTGLTADNIIIERKHGLTEFIAQAIGTLANGIAVTVLPVAARHIDPRSDELLFDGALTLTTWTNPYLTGDLNEQLEEEIHEDMMEALHGYRVAVHLNATTRVNQRLAVTGFSEVDDPEYLRRDTQITTEFKGLTPA